MSQLQPSRLKSALSPTARQERRQQQRDDRYLNSLEETKQQQEKQIEYLKDQVEVVVELTAQNVEKVYNRGEGIDELEQKAERLEESAETFKKHSVKVHSRMRCNNRKACVALIITIIFVIALFVGIGVFLWKRSEQITNPSLGDLGNLVAPGIGDFIPNVKVPSIPNIPAIVRNATSNLIPNPRDLIPQIPS